jgi:hypothetical protein
VLVRAGETVDILLDVTSPGLWMAHCHITEHTESGMVLSFDVSRRSEGGRSTEQLHRRRMLERSVRVDPRIIIMGAGDLLHGCRTLS